MGTRTAVVLAVTVVLLPGLSLAAVTGSPELSATVSEGDLLPGEETAVGVVVLNEGTITSGSTSNTNLDTRVTTARGLTVTLTADDAPLTVETGKQAVGSLGEGKTDPIEFDVVVDERAEPGTYDLPVEVAYVHTSYISEGDGNHEEESVEREFEVSVTVEDAARFDVTDVDSEARIGTTDTLRVNVTNTGTETANDTRMTLESLSPAMTFGDEATAVRHVDRWEPGETRTFSYRVRTAETTRTEEHPFELSGTYEQPDGVREDARTISFGVAPDPEQTFSVGDVEATLRVGDDGTLNGTLTNEGDRPVRNVVLNWVSEQRNVDSTETEYAVGDLGAGESAAFSFDVEVSDAATAGPRQFTLVAEYRDADDDRRTSDELDVRASVEPAADEFAVAVEDATLGVGKQKAIRVTVTNVDDETLSEVSAKLFVDSPISTTDDEAFVAALEPGESATITFGVEAGSDALEKTYPLSMDFQYEEPDGDTVTSDTYSVPVRVEAPSDDGDDGPPLVAVAVVLVLAIVAIVGYRRLG